MCDRDHGGCGRDSLRCKHGPEIMEETHRTRRLAVLETRSAGRVSCVEFVDRRGVFVVRVVV